MWQIVTEMFETITKSPENREIEDDKLFIQTVFCIYISYIFLKFIFWYAIKN